MTSNIPSQNLSEEWLEDLRSSGYRMTGPLVAVVEILSDAPRALSPNEIYDRGRENYPTLGLVSVYRTLEKLEGMNLIQRVHLPDGCHSYIAAFTGHQHLLVCQRCGLTSFFQGDDLSGLISRVERESGYQVKEHWLQLFGTCEDCQDAEAAMEAGGEVG